MPRPPTASDTLPPQNDNHPITSHHVTKTCNFLHNLFLPHRTCVGGAKTSSNRARSSPTAGHLLSDPRPTFRQLPFFEAPLRKFLPGHPGAIHDPWSQHCYAAPATEFPRHWTTRTMRSHAPFARTFPSANETATTKRPQTSRVRDLNQTFCIQKFRDMHICSLIPNIFPNI